MKNYFAILGVHKSSSKDEIKEARRQLAFAAHPDRGGSTDDMVELNAAYATLTQKDARKRYDILLAAAGHACHACQGKGCIRKQVRFGKKETSVCNSCHGAGRIL